MKLSNIDFSKIKFRLLEKLLKDQLSYGVDDFKELKSTVPSKADLKDFGFVKDEFFVDHPIEKVFHHYQFSNPDEAWKGGDWVAFGLAVDKNSGEIFYPGDDYPGGKVGQVLYLHSTIFGLKKLCMAQEIVTIDPTKFLIEFSYIEKGMTTGIQIIQFSKESENKTKITHTSHFKGVSKFRDTYLYPYFHSKIVGKFHENLKRSIG